MFQCIVLQEVDAQHAQQVTVLKDGWAKELKRQREVGSAMGSTTSHLTWLSQARACTAALAPVSNNPLAARHQHARPLMPVNVLAAA